MKRRFCFAAHRCLAVLAFCLILVLAVFPAASAEETPAEISVTLTADSLSWTGLDTDLTKSVSWTASFTVYSLSDGIETPFYGATTSYQSISGSGSYTFPDPIAKYGTYFAKVRITGDPGVGEGISDNLVIVADDPVIITSLAITVPAPVPGNTPSSSLTAVTEPAGVDCTLPLDAWVVTDGSARAAMKATDTFAAWKSYQIAFHVNIPSSGGVRTAKFTDSTAVTVNGVACTFNLNYYGDQMAIIFDFGLLTQTCTVSFDAGSANNLPESFTLDTPKGGNWEITVPTSPVPTCIADSSFKFLGYEYEGAIHQPGDTFTVPVEGDTLNQAVTLSAVFRRVCSYTFQRFFVGVSPADVQNSGYTLICKAYDPDAVYHGIDLSEYTFELTAATAELLTASDGSGYLSWIFDAPAPLCTIRSQNIKESGLDLPGYLRDADAEEVWFTRVGADESIDYLSLGEYYTVVTAVDITVDAPALGEKPSETITLTASADDQVVLVHPGWYKVDPETSNPSRMTDEDVFALHTTYIIAGGLDIEQLSPSAPLVPSSVSPNGAGSGPDRKYVFTENTVITVNGKTLTQLTEEESETAYDGWVLYGNSGAYSGYPSGTGASISFAHAFPQLHEYAQQHDENEHWMACTGEDCTEEKDREAHKYGAWSTVKEPTVNETGTKKHLCTVCGYEATEAIPVLDPDAPATGDGSSATVWTVTAAAAAVLLGICFIEKKKHISVN